MASGDGVNGPRGAAEGGRLHPVRAPLAQSGEKTQMGPMGRG